MPSVTTIVVFYFTNLTFFSVIFGFITYVLSSCSNVFFEGRICSVAISFVVLFADSEENEE